MEVNARLQVEHPVTEVGHGARPRAAAAPHRRRRAARGRPAAAAAGTPIEVRLNAEDPGAGLRPRARGGSSLLRLPERAGRPRGQRRRRGRHGPAEFDSMIAKIIAYGADRDQAIARLRRAVADTMVVDRRGHHQPGLPARAARPPRAARRRGRHRLARPPPAPTGDVESVRHADAALVQAAIALCDDGDRRRRAPASTRSPAAGARRPSPRSATVVDLLPPRRRATAAPSASVGPGRYQRGGRRRAHRGHVEELAVHERRLTLRRPRLPHA